MANLLTESTGSHSMTVTSTSAVWPIDGIFPITNGSWSKSGLSITLAGAFTNYVYVAGDQLYLNGATNGFQPGWYTVASRVSANVITIADDSRVNLTNATGTTNLTGYIIGNGASGNRGAVSTTAAESILATGRGTVIERINIKTLDAAAARVITIAAHDGTTVIHSYNIGFNAAVQSQLPFIDFGPCGRFVKGGISAFTANASTTFEVIFRRVG